MANASGVLRSVERDYWDKVVREDAIIINALRLDATFGADWIAQAKAEPWPSPVTEPEYRGERT